ncbi:MAG TPA: hypothetical protein VKC64_05810 [Burkholderiales bacterium]|nr:hypothetical protein [Burkholderiales bacterium]
MKSYVLRIHVASNAGAPNAAVAGIVEDPDTGQMWRFHEPHELWAIVSRATSTEQAVWQPGQGGYRFDRKE